MRTSASPRNDQVVFLGYFEQSKGRWTTLGILGVEIVEYSLMLHEGSKDSEQQSVE